MSDENFLHPVMSFLKSKQYMLNMYLKVPKITELPNILVYPPGLFFVIIMEDDKEVVPLKRK
jgi:hypothetical protein